MGKPVILFFEPETTFQKSCSVSTMPQCNFSAIATCFCFRSKTGFFRWGMGKASKDFSPRLGIAGACGLGTVAVGKSVDFKERKISLRLLVLLGQAESTRRKEILFLRAYSPENLLDPKPPKNHHF